MSGVPGERDEVELAAVVTPLPPATASVDAAHDTVRYDALTRDYNDLPTYPVRPSYKEFHSKLRVETQCVVFDGCPKDPHKPASTPIYQTATFVQPSSTEFGAYDYTRSGNPTRTALEKQVAMLEGAHAAFAFTSGMAALVAVTRLLAAGDELLVGDDIYGGMHRLVSRVTSQLHGIRVRFIDVTDLGKVAAAISPATRMVHMETPSNPLMRVTDIRALAALLHSRGVLLSIDSTMMSPILQRPLQLGADVVVHSATKFFGGHSDVMGGLVCLRDEALSKRIAFFQNAEGTGLEPFGCWLFLRGIKTLALRVERAQENAMLVAEHLHRSVHVARLYYAGVKPAAGDARAARDYEIHFSQSRGAGCVMSFTTGSVALSRRFIDALRIFKLTVSFGSVNSLCEMPCVMSHASVPADKRTLAEDLIRLSIGIEDVRDLIHDIDQAFELAANAHVHDVRAVRRRGSSAAVDVATLDPSAPTAAGGGSGGAAASGAAAGGAPRATSGGAAGGAGAAAVAAEGGSDAEKDRDAAQIARGEVARLQAVVGLLKERLAEVEARAAGAEAARRVAAAGGGGGGGGGFGAPALAGAASGAGWLGAPSGPWLVAGVACGVAAAVLLSRPRGGAL